MAVSLWSCFPAPETEAATTAAEVMGSVAAGGTGFPLTPHAVWCSLQGCQLNSPELEQKKLGLVFTNLRVIQICLLLTLAKHATSHPLSQHSAKHFHASFYLGQMRATG